MLAALRLDKKFIRNKNGARRLPTNAQHGGRRAKSVHGAVRRGGLRDGVVCAGVLGHYGEGVLALERYLLNRPDNVSARLQLGRGYYLLGDDAQAHTELEALRKLDPPAPASAAPRAVASRDSSPARRRRAQVWPSPPVSDSAPV